MRRYWFFILDLLRMLRIARRWPIPGAMSILKASSISELHALVRRRPIQAFNGQIVRTRYLIHLFRVLGCTSFMETGTYYGTTAVAARYLFDSPVFTVELLHRFHWIAKLHAHIVGVDGIHFARADSREALARWLSEGVGGERPMLYLDGHWFKDHPLHAEVALAVAHGHCVAIVDDCRVPGDLSFGYDNQFFAEGSPYNFVIGLESLRDVLPPDRVIALQPSHRAADETGLKRGTLVLLVDLPLPDGALDPLAASLFERVEM